MFSRKNQNSPLDEYANFLTEDYCCYISSDDFFMLQRAANHFENWRHICLQVDYRWNWGSSSSRWFNISTWVVQKSNRIWTRSWCPVPWGRRMAPRPFRNSNGVVFNFWYGLSNKKKNRLPKPEMSSVRKIGEWEPSCIIRHMGGRYIMVKTDKTEDIRNADWGYPFEIRVAE